MRRLLPILLLAAGCIGTDRVADSVTTTPPRIELRPVLALLRVDEQLSLAATEYDSLGMVVTGSPIVWGVSDASIATVDSAGRLTGKKPGETIVVATTGTLSSNAATIKVVPDTLAVMRRTATLVPGPVANDTARGTVVLEVGGDGVLRLDFGSDFRSMGGPGLEVFLAEGAAVDAPGFGLGRLKSTVGAQSYEVPATVGLNDYDYVVVRCVPFRINFGIGKLE